MRYDFHPRAIPLRGSFLGDLPLLQRFKPFREVYALVQVIHAACRVFFSKPIASLKDVSEREGHAFVLDKVVQFGRLWR